MCKKRKPSREPVLGGYDEYTEMWYDLNTQSMKAPRQACSTLTSQSEQHYVKTPMIATKPAKDIELQEIEEDAVETYIMES